MPYADDRDYQRFPVLTSAQIETARRFASGPEQHFAPGATIYAIGEVGVASWMVTEGSMEVVRRDGLSGEAPIVTHGVGQFSGEVNQLTGRPSIAGATAGPQGCTALPFDPPHLRALMVGSADVGEVVMRALILRRVGLIGEGGSGTILIGVPDSAEMVRLQGFLARSGYPHLVIDVNEQGEGRALVERSGVTPEQLPLVVCPSGPILRRPSEAELAACLGIMPVLDPAKVYDLAVVGAGPSGLATAVYAASEGLSVIVLDAQSMGGQAGASARIENYLGFPTGISGHALAARAFNQALKFGAEVAIPVEVERLDCSAELPALELAGGHRLLTRSVVIASGARYRRPDLPNLADFDGTGISYWASPIEARLSAGQEIALVGGGNSAGQAVVYLAPYVKRLHLIVRRDLAQTMSRYLIDRIAALPNVEMHIGSEISALEGTAATGLTGVSLTQRASGTTEHRAIRHLFLFIGADPNSGWVKDCVDTDDKGFVITGSGALPLETSVPGVFAIGDVRAGSTKRVAAAVGEGAAVVAQIHAMLAARAAKEAA